MADILIHNISDRPNSDSPAHAITIGGQTVRPGKCIAVDEGLISRKFTKLHGTTVWIGELPAKFKATSRAALRALSEEAEPMTIEEVREYLATLGKEELLHLCEQMSPALVFAKEPSSRMLVVKIARACFSTRVLDPESFLWLRRWVKQGNLYLERD